MKILLISGSVREESSNVRLLTYFKNLFSKHECKLISYLHEFPIFYPDHVLLDPSILSSWSKDVDEADLIIISTPEYIFNMPALLKNAFEWLTASGEFDGKKVIAFTFTPHAPRGEKAMQSMLASLKALNCNVLLSENLYLSEIKIDVDLYSNNADFESSIQEFINSM